MKNKKVVLTTLYNINKDENKVYERYPKRESAKSYIINLINSLVLDKNIRTFTPKVPNGLVINSIKKFCNNLKSIQEIAASMDTFSPETNRYNLFYNISEKLLAEQRIAQSKYQKLTDIKKGSLFQSIISTDTYTIYLLALVDFNKFLDETDLDNRSGLPYKNKACKSCLVYLNTQNEIEKICVTDTNGKISEYWYDGFLDLVECKDNTTNTKCAYKLIRQVLTQTLKNSPADMTSLTQALNSYFFQNEIFSLDKCSGFLFSSYEPTKKDLDIDSIKNKVLNLSNSPNFDNLFEINKKAIKKELKQTYTINNKVQLKINTPIDKMKESIYSDKLKDGEKVLIIKSIDDNIYKKFNFKEKD